MQDLLADVTEHIDSALAEGTSSRLSVGQSRRNARRYAFCMAQLVTRVDDRLVEQIDELVDQGVVASRSEAVRFALADLIDRHRRRRIGSEIVEAYRRLPQTEAELGWADDATRRMIAEEPW